MKILNLYAGVGGNRKFWRGDVTAVERDPKIAAVYASLYPDDEVIVGDAHEYLLANFEDFDFIWTSPPCQSHSRFTRSGRNRTPRYPDMKLYEEILLLQHNHQGRWVVENVEPYYEPLIPPMRAGRHCIWANFTIGLVEEPPAFGDFMNSTNMKARQNLMDWLGIHFDDVVYVDGNHCPAQVLRNCVHPDVGRQIFDAMVHSHGLFGIE